MYAYIDKITGNAIARDNAVLAWLPDNNIDDPDNLIVAYNTSPEVHRDNVASHVRNLFPAVIIWSEEDARSRGFDPDNVDWRTVEDQGTERGWEAMTEFED